MYWEKFPITRERREWTSRRLKAAQRAVDREADAMALEDLIVDQLRNNRARCWKEARAMLRNLSATEKESLLTKWETRFMPGSPENLIGLATMMGIWKPEPLK